MENSGLPHSDYRDRSYLSAAESARYLGITVEDVHSLVGSGELRTKISASGQMRFRLDDLVSFEVSHGSHQAAEGPLERVSRLNVRGTSQTVVLKSSAVMEELADGSVNLMVTSPPYFDAKMYSRERVEGELGNIHEVSEWFDAISSVWKEVYRVLQPGRKAFVNIMNLPVRVGDGGFRALNLVGKTVDLLEQIGFVFKRDIIWQKTNSVRAHFGTYPYPGGILINNSHESILEFEKPCRKGYRKYSHVSQEERERSRLDREFWLKVKNSDVWVMHPQGSGDRRSHVAPFPPELPYRLIRAYSFVGELVLDPFLGSGTTLAEAARLGRNGIGYEIVDEIGLTALESLGSMSVEQ